MIAWSRWVRDICLSTTGDGICALWDFPIKPWLIPWRPAGTCASGCLLRKRIKKWRKSERERENKIDEQGEIDVNPISVVCLSFRENVARSYNVRVYVYVCISNRVVPLTREVLNGEVLDDERNLRYIMTSFFRMREENRWGWMESLSQARLTYICVYQLCKLCKLVEKNRERVNISAMNLGSV